MSYQNMFLENTATFKNRSFTLDSIKHKFFWIQCLLTTTHVLLFVGFVLYQFIQPVFLNSDTWVFVYWFLFLSFSIDFLYFYFYDKVWKSAFFRQLLLFTDALLMTICLSAALPMLYSVLVFVYMLHIVSAGLMGKYKGAFTQGLLSSFLFSCALILYSSVTDSEHSLMLSFVLNNVGFMSVAGLSGFFGAQAHKLNWSLMNADKMVDQLENLNELIVNNIDMGLFILDERAHVLYANKQAGKILTLPEGFSANVYNVLPGLRPYISSLATISIRKAGQMPVTNYIEMECPNGSYKKTIEVFVSSIKEEVTEPYLESSESDDGQKYLVLFQDCTHIREMEKRAMEKEKLSGIGRMAVGIAHEIRNPLSSIGGSIQLLDLKNKDRNENNRLMNMALREISRLNGIIGEFLDYTADENKAESAIATPPEPLSINPILEELLDNVRVSAGWEHITYHTILKAQGLISAPPDKLKQILWNIVKNSCEAMADQAQGRLAIESFDDDKWVVIQVKDTGGGISEKDKQHIFEPFYSTKAKGVGLGLAITRKLVLLYKGELSYQNSDNGGAICTLRFPIQPNFFPGEMARRKSA